MDLLTVTCDRDFEITTVQAKSIQKYLATCTHWVLVNDTSKTREEWIDALTPFYTRHKLNLLFSQDFPYFTQHGWISQQIYKCLAVTKINNDYVIIDAKNFFIKPTDLSKWTHEGSGRVEIMPTHPILPKDVRRFHEADIIVRKYCEVIGVDLVPEVFSVTTPFIVRKYIMNKVVDFLMRDNIFLRDPTQGYPWHSEFILYSIFANQVKLPFSRIAQIWSENGKSLVFWEGCDDFDDYYTKLNLFDDFQLSGVHRSWLITASQENKNKIVTWLESIEILTPEFKKKLS